MPLVFRDHTLGRCQFMTCASMLGAHSRLDLYDFRNHVQHREVLLCSEHTMLSKESGIRLLITDEGWVYPEVLIQSLLGGH